MQCHPIGRVQCSAKQKSSGATRKVVSTIKELDCTTEHDVVSSVTYETGVQCHTREV